jgi:hypothetical protein
MSSAYHPQTDGSTERANRTVTQMLCQCVDDKQKDWVSKLPAIEFAINSARSESTGYSPFFLNSGRMPRLMIWKPAPQSKFPSIRNFAQQKRLAIMSAHDSIIAACVKQTRNANQKRQMAPFKEDNLVYISSKNISFKGLARKLIPKFLGPYKITRDFGNFSYKIELPPSLRKRGLHDVFHASLLRIHHPNDGRLFSGRSDAQINPDDDSEGEWAVDKLISHSGSGEDSIFEIKWKAGDITWLPYRFISHLPALSEYLELLGVREISSLKTGSGKPPQDDPQIFLGEISPFPKGDTSVSYINSSDISPISLHPSFTPSLSNASLSPLTSIPSLMTRNRRNNQSGQTSHTTHVVSHPNFTVSGLRVLVRDHCAADPRIISTHVQELEHCVNIDALARTQTTAAIEQARLSTVYTSVARAFNSASNNSRRKFAIITDGISIVGDPIESITHLGIDPNIIQSQTGTFTHDEVDAANQMFRQTIVHQFRKKAQSITEQ